MDLIRKILPFHIILFSINFEDIFNDTYSKLSSYIIKTGDDL